jgi:hypothetical protein
MNLQLKEPRVLLLPSRDARAGFISVGSEREETCPSQERLRFIAKRGGGGGGGDGMRLIKISKVGITRRDLVGTISVRESRQASRASTFYLPRTAVFQPRPGYRGGREPLRG